MKNMVLGLDLCQERLKHLRKSALPMQGPQPGNRRPDNRRKLNKNMKSIGDFNSG